MDFADSGGVAVAYQVTGSGQPTTCFVPGLTQTMADARIFGSAVVGSRVFLDLRGHGASQAASADGDLPLTLDALADDVAAVASATAATRAVGVSLGASALMALMVRAPARFDRVVLALPSSVDQPRAPEQLAITDQLADAVAAHDPIETARLLLLLQPEAVRTKVPVMLWSRRHAAELNGPAVVRVLRTLPREVPLPDPEPLQTFDRPVLVLAQSGDEAHPIAAAHRLVELLPNAHLVVSDEPWIWRARELLREVVSEFLNQ